MVTVWVSRTVRVSVKVPTSWVRVVGRVVVYVVSAKTVMLLETVTGKEVLMTWVM